MRNGTLLPYPLVQEAFSAIERCRWPVIAAVQGIHRMAPWVLISASAAISCWAAYIQARSKTFWSRCLYRWWCGHDCSLRHSVLLRGCLLLHQGLAASCFQLQRCLPSTVNQPVSSASKIVTDAVRGVLQEVDLAITADLGSLQRLPHIIGHGAPSPIPSASTFIKAVR